MLLWGVIIMKLFEVCFKSYIRLYVEANGYDEAINKALEYRKSNRITSITSTSITSTRLHSLKKEEDDEVIEVRITSDFVLR